MAILSVINGKILNFSSTLDKVQGSDFYFKIIFYVAVVSACSVKSKKTKNNLALIWSSGLGASTNSARGTSFYMQFEIQGLFTEGCF